MPSISFRGHDANFYADMRNMEITTACLQHFKCVKNIRILLLHWIPSEHFNILQFEILILNYSYFYYFMKSLCKLMEMRGKQFRERFSHATIMSELFIIHRCIGLISFPSGDILYISHTHLAVLPE